MSLISKHVIAILERLRGVSLSADDAEQIMNGVRARIADTDQRVLELNVQEALSAYCRKQGPLTEMEFNRLSAIMHRFGAPPTSDGALAMLQRLGAPLSVPDDLLPAPVPASDGLVRGPGGQRI